MAKVLYINDKGQSGSKNTLSDGKSLAFNIKTTDKDLVKQVSPTPGNTKKAKGKYKMNYDISDEMSMDQILEKLHKTLGIIDESTATSTDIFNTSTRNYNRFKMPTVNDILQKGFGHVFFVRPNCNVLVNSGTQLTNNLKNNPIFSYVMKSTPNLVKELVLDNGKNNDFMFSLSNHSTSFSLNEEYINTDTYGKTFTGYKIAYGKNSIESKTAGTLTLNFQDDRDMHIYQIHKLWLEYISGVYRGEIIPRPDDIFNKVLDYAGACYYIVTAEDNESILFWTKYYGIFPTNLPSDQFSWAKGNVIGNANDISVTYAYSFKVDYDPTILTEFNKNARVYNISNLKYAPVYDKDLGHVGQTWVGTPFIDCVTNGSKPNYKLRYLRD